jgi:hypothetical protein
MTMRQLCRVSVAVFLLLAAGTAQAVVLDDENVVTVALGDGTKVVLYGEANTSVGAPPSGAPPNVKEMAEKALGPTDSRLQPSPGPRRRRRASP